MVASHTCRECGAKLNEGPAVVRPCECDPEMWYLHPACQYSRACTQCPRKLWWRRFFRAGINVGFLLGVAMMVVAFVMYIYLQTHACISMNNVIEPAFWLSEKEQRHCNDTIWFMFLYLGAGLGGLFTGLACWIGLGISMLRDYI